MNSITSFLQRNNDPSTHLSLMTYSTHEKYWYINPNSFIGFFNIYNETYLDNKDISVSEICGDQFPIIIDLKLVFDNIGDQFLKPFDYNLIYSFVSCLQDAICAIYDTSSVSSSNDSEDQLLYCHYLVYNKHKIIDDKVHYYCRFIFPYFKIDNNAKIWKLFTEKVHKNLRTVNTMKYFSKQPIGSWEQLIDFNVTKNPVLMYGSRDLNKRYFYFNKIIPYIDINNFEESIENLVAIEFDDYTTQYTTHSYNTLEGNYELKVDYNNLIQYLPILYSVNFSNEVLKSKPLVTLISDKKDTSFNNASENLVDIMKELLQMINKKKFCQDNTICEIGCAIRNTYFKQYKKFNYESTFDEAFKLWRYYIELYNSNKYDFSVDIEVYDKTKFRLFTEYFTVKTIAEHARQDNPQKYKLWHDGWCKYALDMSINSCNQTNICKFFSRKYWLDFIVCSKGGTIFWYYFNGVKLEESEEIQFIYNFIQNDFRNDYIMYLNKLKLKKQECDEKSEEIKLINASIKTVNNIIEKHLSSDPKIKSNISMLSKSNLLYIERFDEIENTNPNITPVENGVMEVVGKKLLFRKGKIEDFYTIGFSAAYDDTITSSSPCVVAFINWMTQLFEDKETVNFMLLFISALLKGYNREKLFPFLSGFGDNSKTELINQLFLVLGDMAVKISSSYLTERRTASSNANPDIIRMIGKRLIVFQEVEAFRKLISGVIKELTGNDDIPGRGLFDKKIKDRKLPGRVIIVCNKPPKPDLPEQSLYNRIVEIFVNCVYSLNAPEDPSEQLRRRIFKKDLNFRENNRAMKSAILWIMSKFFPTYMENGLVPSKYILRTTDSYWKINDDYKRFIYECIDQTESDEDILSLDEVYEVYTLWFESNNPKRVPSDSSLLKYELEVRWNQRSSDENTWKGYVIKDNKKINRRKNDYTRDMTSPLTPKQMLDNFNAQFLTI